MSQNTTSHSVEESSKKLKREIPEDEEYDPTYPTMVNNKEWMLERINHEGKTDNYAGAWPRSWVENARHAPRQPVWVGVSEKSGREFGIKFTQTFRHILLLGATGGGKTMQLYHILTMLAFGGHGWAIADPKGDDIFEHLLRRIPEWRKDDLVYMDLGADYYTLEDPETGEEVPHQTGFNILNTHLEPGDPGYDQEVEWIVTNFMEILDIPPSWSKARRDLKTLIRGMIRHDEEFTPIEVYYALDTEENRQQFAHLLGDSIGDDDIRFIESHMNRIVEQTSDTDLDPLLGKLQDWIQNPTARNAIAQRGSDITLGDIVRNQMLLVVNTDLPDPVDKMVANLVKTGVWSAVTSRKSAAEKKLMEFAGVEDPGEVYAPFYLAIDECHAVFEEGDNVEQMMFEARSKQLGLILSTQKIRSLPDDVADAMLSEANTAIILSTRHSTEQSEISKRFGDLDGETLAKIPDFHAITQINNEDEPFLAMLAPPYPPIRTLKETYELVIHSLKNWASPVGTPKEQLDEMHFEAGVSFGDDGEVEVDPLGGDEQAEYVVLKRLYDEQIRHDDVVAPTELSDSEAHHAIGEEFDIQMTQAAQVIEVLTSKELIRSRLSDGETRITVTSDGLERLGLSSGSGGAGGGAVHRELLRRLYVEFTQIGYNCEIPSQEGDELPDLIGHLPPELDDLSLSQALSTLREEYPAIVEISGDGKLIVEVESKGISKPGGPVKNFADIMENPEGSAMFAVADGGSDGFTENARRLSNIFTSPPMVNSRCPKDADRKFYRKGPCPAEHIPASEVTAGTEYAIYPESSVSISWVELPSGEIICRTSDGEVIASFEDIEAFTKRSAADFPGVTYYDRDADVHVAEWDAEGGRTSIKRATKRELAEVVTVIQKPTVPELMFEDVPEGPEDVAEDMTMVIVPDEPEDENAPLPEPEVYDLVTGETTPFSDHYGLDSGERSRTRGVNPAETSTEDENLGESSLSLEERMKQLGLTDD